MGGSVSVCVFCNGGKEKNRGGVHAFIFKSLAQREKCLGGGGGGWLQFRERIRKTEEDK